MTRQRFPHQLQITGDGVRAPGLREPDCEINDGEQCDEQGRSRGKTKAANGETNATADGQKDCGGA